MKKKLFLLIIFILVCINNVFSNGIEKIKTAILPFYLKGKLDTNLVNLFCDNLASSMGDTKIYSIIDKTSVDQIFDVLKIQKNSELSDKIAIDIGASIRASIVVVGAIAVVDGSYFVSIRGIDTKSGNEIFKENELVTGDTNLLKLADNFTKSISKKNTKTNLDYSDNKDSSNNSESETKIIRRIPSKGEVARYTKLSKNMKILGKVGLGGFIPSITFVLIGSILTGVGNYNFLNNLTEVDNYYYITYKPNYDYYYMYCAGLGLIGVFIPFSMIFLALLIAGYAASHVFNNKALGISMYMENRQAISCTDSLYRNDPFQVNPCIGVKFSFK